MDKLTLTLVKTKTFELEPFGKFKIAWCPSKARKLKNNIIPLDELEFDHSDGMPYTKSDDQAFCKYMIKHKTDVLTDGANLKHPKFYSRIGDSWVEIKHPKLTKYHTFLYGQAVNNVEDLVDSDEHWQIFLNLYLNL